MDGCPVGAAVDGKISAHSQPRGLRHIIPPYVENLNAGYILLDLDHGDPAALDLMQAHGHEPCVVLQTSPGHLQAWIRVSPTPLEPVVATAIARQLACAYRGDLASADWRHLGRLAGFTNQKKQRRLRNGYAHGNLLTNRPRLGRGKPPDFGDVWKGAIFL